MALDTSSNGNFNTRNPGEAVKVIENLASSNSTKNTDFERRKSATILGNDQMDEVKAKLNSVHKLLRKQVCLVEDAEAIDTEGRAEEEEVNFIGGTGFQGSGNQGGNINSYENRAISTKVNCTRNPTATTTATTTWVMKSPTTRSHHHLLKKASLKRCLIGFLRDISA